MRNPITWLGVAMLTFLVYAFAVPGLYHGPMPKIPLTRAVLAPNGAIDNALQCFRYDIGRFPTTDESLAALWYRPPSVPAGQFHGPYLRIDFNVLVDAWNHFLVYQAPGLHNPGAYDLYSWGPNGIDESGTKNSDDITNWQ